MTTEGGGLEWELINPIDRREDLILVLVGKKLYYIKQPIVATNTTGSIGILLDWMTFYFCSSETSWVRCGGWPLSSALICKEYVIMNMKPKHLSSDGFHMVPKVFQKLTVPEKSSVGYFSGFDEVMCFSYEVHMLFFSEINN